MNTFKKIVAPVLVWAALSAVVLGCTDARAQPAQGARAAPQWSPQVAQDRDLLLTLTVRARRCMYDGSEAMFRNGVTARVPVTHFTVGMCSEQLSWFFRERAAMSPEDSQLLVRALADAEYDDAIRWGQRRR